MKKDFKIIIVDDRESSIHILIEDGNNSKEKLIADGIYIKEGIRRQEIVSKTESKYNEIKLNLEDLDINTFNTFLIAYLTKNRDA